MQYVSVLCQTTSAESTTMPKHFLVENVTFKLKNNTCKDQSEGTA